MIKKITNKKGLFSLDSIIGNVILLLIVFGLVSSSQLYNTGLRNVENEGSRIDLIQNHLMSVSTLKWDELNNKTANLSNQVTVSYKVEETSFNTDKIILRFNTPQKEYEFAIERAKL